MKAVVVEIAGKNAIALSKSGEFVKIRNNGNIRIGYEVELPSAKVFKINTFIKAASIAAVFLFVSCTGYGIYSYATPYSYIGVDINPSIELVANRYSRIISAEGLNNDGKKLLELNSYKNKSIEEGIRNILKSAEEKGYLKADDKNAVMVSVTGKDDSKVNEIEGEVKEAAKETLGSNNADSAVIVEKTTLQKRIDAEKLGVSPGKLSLMEKLIKENPELKVEDLKNESVKEIMKQVTAARKVNQTNKIQNQTGSKAGNNNTTGKGKPESKTGSTKTGKGKNSKVRNYNEKDTDNAAETDVKEPTKMEGTQSLEGNGTVIDKPDNEEDSDESEQTTTDGSGTSKSSKDNENKGQSESKSKKDDKRNKGNGNN